MTLFVTFATAKATAAGLLVLRIRRAVIVSGESGYDTTAICIAGSCADTPPPNALAIITTTAMLLSFRTLSYLSGERQVYRVGMLAPTPVRRSGPDRSAVRDGARP